MCPLHTQEQVYPPTRAQSASSSGDSATPSLHQGNLGNTPKFPQNWTWPGSGMVLPANDLSECPPKFSGPKMPASCCYWQISHSVSTCFQDPCSLSEKTLKRSSSHVFSSEHCLSRVVVIVLSGYLMENKYDKNNECYKI